MIIFSNIYTLTDGMTCIKAMLNVAYTENIKLRFGNLPGHSRVLQNSLGFSETINCNQLAAFLSRTKYSTNTFGSKG